MPFNALSFFGEGIPAGVGAFAQTTRERQRRESQEAMMRRMEEQRAEDRRFQRAILIGLMGDNPAFRELLAPSAGEVRQSGAGAPVEPLYRDNFVRPAELNAQRVDFAPPPPPPREDWGAFAPSREDREALAPLPPLNYSGMLNPTGRRF